MIDLRSGSQVRSMGKTQIHYTLIRSVQIVQKRGHLQQISLAIGGIIFGPRSIFDPVMAGQRSYFRKFYDFSTLRVHISKTIYRSGMKPSPACSPFHSAQNEVL